MLVYDFLNNNRIILYIAIIFLVFSIVFCAVGVEYAHALAPAIPIVGVVGTILIAAGLMFDTDTDLETAANSFYNYLSGDAFEDISSIIGAYSSVVNGSFKFKVTPNILASLGDWLASKDWSTSDTGELLFAVPGSLVIEGIDYSWAPLLILDVNETFNTSRDKYSDFFPPDLPINIKNAKGVSRWLVASEDGTCFYTSSNNSLSGNLSSRPYDSLLLLNKGDDYRFMLSEVGSNSYSFFYQLCGPGYPAQVDSHVSGSMVGVNSTYFPREFTTSGVDMTSFPANTASQPITTDIPLTIPETGVDVNSGVGDVRGELEEQTGLLEQIWNGILAIPEAIAGALQGLLDFLLELVLPTDTLWNNFLGEVIDIVAPPNSVDFTDYVNSIEIPDVTVNWKGETLTIVDNSNLRNNVETWRSYIGAFLAVLIIIYNYNMFMKLIGHGTLTVTESGRVSNNLALPSPKGKE